MQQNSPYIIIHEIHALKVLSRSSKTCFDNTIMPQTLILLYSKAFGWKD